MSNFDVFKDTVMQYFKEYGISVSCLSNLHKDSLNEAGDRYLYNGELDFKTISMDTVAKDGYKQVKGTLPEEHPINTVDSFLINRENEWFLIEFKDCPVKGDKQKTKDNIIKKAYANWYMILDIFYTMMEQGNKSSIFDVSNPVKFAEEHVHYILVCSKDKNANLYNQVKNHALMNQNYTPPFMRRLKDYIFKDAYVYTEDFFERKFVNSFTY